MTRTSRRNPVAAHELYRAREVSEAPILFFTQSCEDADILRSHGFAATTAPGGIWRAEYAEALRGREIIFVFDPSEALNGPTWTAYGALRGKAARTLFFHLREAVNVGDWLTRHRSIELAEQIDAYRDRRDEAVQ